MNVAKYYQCEQTMDFKLLNPLWWSLTTCTLFLRTGTLRHPSSNNYL